MIDELDRVFEEQERGRKGRHRRGARNRGKRGGAVKTTLAFLMAFLLLGTLAGGAWYGFDRIQALFTTPDYAGTGTGQVTIEVKAGQTIAEIGNTLVTAGVVKSVQAFIEAAEANRQSEKIQPGVYRLRSQMSGEAAVAMLLDLKNRVINGITIPEGRSAKQVYKLLSEKTKIPVAQFEAAAKNPIALGVPNWWFNRSDGKKVAPSIEGFLYPDTYEVAPKPTAAGILREMVQNFLTVTGEMKFAERVQKERGGISPYEALIVASLAQAEAGNKDDLGKVARVAYNRAYKDFPCGCLEMDVTVNYYLELTGQQTKTSKQMTESELDNPNNPYNRKLRGMIPTPINNPGKDALQGAMAPPPGNWLYFVAIDKQGHSAFADTWEEHLRNQARAKEAGVI
jgi:UPF0755 protein